MPRLLREENTFTDGLFIPRNGEDATVESIEELFGGLVNRTRFLKNSLAGLDQRLDGVEESALRGVQTQGDLVGAGTPAEPLGLSAAAEDAIKRGSRFRVTFDGLRVTVGAGRVTGLANGASLEFGGGQIDVPAGSTTCLVFDLFDQALHVLPRAIHGGAVLLATVTSSATTVTGVTQPDTFVAPLSFTERFQRRLARALQPVRVALFGDSLTEGAGTGVPWRDRVFTPGSPTSLPRAQGIEVRNFAVGGSTSHLGAAMTGQLALGFGDAFAGTVLTATAPAASRLLDVEARASDAVDADLVWVAYGANGGEYSLTMIETIVRQARAAGAEVVIGTQNFRTDNLTAGYDAGPALQAIAAAYGCAVCDTWSYVMEARWRGEQTHADVIHMADAGQAAYAAAVRSVLNDLPQMAGSGSVGSAQAVRRVAGVPESEIARKGPGAAHVQVLPTSTTGTWVADGQTRPEVHLGKRLAGLPDTACTLRLDAGQEALYGHPHAHFFEVLVDLETAFTCEVRGTGGTVVGQINNPGTGYRALSLQSVPLGLLGNWGDISPGLPGYAAKPVTLRCTSGSMRVLAVVWHVFPGAQLNLRDLDVRGTWTRGGAADGIYGYPEALWTDTPGDTATLDFVGTGAQLLLAGINTAGTVDVWLDGRKTQANLDLYRPGVYAVTLDLHAGALTDRFDAGYGRHTVKVRLTGANGAAVAVGAGKHRLTILAAHTFDAR